MRECRLNTVLDSIRRGAAAVEGTANTTCSWLAHLLILNHRGRLQVSAQCREEVMSLMQSVCVPDVTTTLIQHYYNTLSVAC